MIKRSESSPSESRRQRTKREKRRRLKMEGLEQRQLLAGDVPTLPPGFDFPTFTEPRNIGTVQAFAFNESESAAATLGNDTPQTADFVHWERAPESKTRSTSPDQWASRSMPLETY